MIYLDREIRCQLLDAYKIRQDFAILDQVVNDEPLVYLDNAATTQKPQVVLDTSWPTIMRTMPMFTVVCTLAERNSCLRS